MNVASLKLCKELYELSGWKADTHHFKKGKPHRHGVFIETTHTATDIPAYDLGYLLRKLHMQQPSLWLSGFGNWEIVTQIPDIEDHEQFEATAPTPEDAAAKLAIELIKAKVIKEL